MYSLNIDYDLQKNVWIFSNKNLFHNLFVLVLKIIFLIPPKSKMRQIIRFWSQINIQFEYNQ